MNHNQNSIYKILSKDVYNQRSQKLPDNWKSIAELESINAKTGFHSRIYQNSRSGEIVISYEGTDLSSIKDWENDIAMGMDKVPSQYTDALLHYANIKTKYPNAKITFTGHSLGGSIAQLMSRSTGNPAVTFGAFGTEKIINNNLNIFKKQSKITNYGIGKDATFSTNLKHQPGGTFILPDLDKRTDFTAFCNQDPIAFYNQDPITYAQAESLREVKSRIFESHRLENYPNLDLAKQYHKKNAQPTGQAAPIQEDLEELMKEVARSIISVIDERSQYAKTAPVEIYKIKSLEPFELLYESISIGTPYGDKVYVSSLLLDNNINLNIESLSEGQSFTESTAYQSPSFSAKISGSIPNFLIDFYNYFKQWQDRFILHEGDFVAVQELGNNTYVILEKVQKYE